MLNSQIDAAAKNDGHSRRSTFLIRPAAMAESSGPVTGHRADNFHKHTLAYFFRSFAFIIISLISYFIRRRGGDEENREERK